MMTKNFKGLLILNWKDGKIRHIQGKAKQTYKPYEVPIRLNIDLEIPDTEEHEIKGSITVPEPIVNKMLLEAV